MLVHLMANLCGMAIGMNALSFFFAAEAIAGIVVVILGGLKRAK